MTTSPTTDYVTKAEFERAMEHIDAKFELLDARMESRIERAFATTVRWVVGLAFGQYALMFALILFVVSRELAHV
jgi:hypothetical protein